jgi:ubiquinone/menaquinone biosynthesis C-methylase UbiE
VSFYEHHILPRLIDLVMRDRAIARERRAIVPDAAGRVVEIGVGSGLNFPFYEARVDLVVAIDPSVVLLHIARARVHRSPVRVRLVRGSAEAIPAADETADTVVTTWTLCSIPDERRALGEMRRVLRPGGRLLFVEHGLAPDRRVRAWQDRLTPWWRRVAGGCRLNLPIRQRIEEAGFSLLALDASYGRGPKPMSYLYRGVATRAGS